jgi:hypothetical protein
MWLEPLWGMGSADPGVIEAPVVPVQVIQHVFVAQVCLVCERRRAPKVALQGVAASQQRLGVNLVSLMVTLREEERLLPRTLWGSGASSVGALNASSRSCSSLPKMSF